MSESNDDKGKKPLSLGNKAGGGTLSLKGNAAAQARQNLSGGSRGTVVEVRRRRVAGGRDEAPQSAAPQQADTGSSELHNLSSAEREARAKALREALAQPKKERVEDERDSEIGTIVHREEPKKAEPKMTIEEARRRELEELEKIEAEEKARQKEADRQRQDQVRSFTAPSTPSSAPFAGRPAAPGAGRVAEPVDNESMRDRMRRNTNPRNPRGGEENRWSSGKLTVSKVLNQDSDRDGGRSLASVKRAREKARKIAMGSKEPAQKVYREVVIPEVITVQELANRMAERSADVVKALMKLGVMATINQSIDADTAELIVTDFGHTVRRVTESDVETDLGGGEDTAEQLVSRPPVVTIMGHVDHGKTSLLDALRSTDVVSGEAGGITQHIGAYQVTLKSGDKITFLDTPGHAAFTEMRARGANVTDIVVLVVSAADSIMPQTIEAINHAKAAGVPIIVAVNKVDLPDANPQKVKQDLLQHEIIVEELGGDTMCVEISAKKRINLDKLEEAILLQAEVLELKVNPNRDAVGAVVESKMEIGRGSVATVLIQRGTLKQGDIFVVGAEWGRVRALYDDRGNQLQKAVPGQPVEVLGLTGTPDAGDILNVVENEAKAREVSEYRARKKRERASAALSTNRQGKSFEDILAAAKVADNKKILPVLIKGDVHGSVEAIIGSLGKLTEESTEIGIQVLHSGVGGITESDITLAKASNAFVIGFNVRANAQARVQAEREGVQIRYYNIIYNVIDDARAVLSGMLSPTRREDYLGQAEIRQVFNITKVGKIGGCMVTTGMVKRGAGVRLLRDNVVIHEGTLKTLKRFKDEVKEVKEGMECGMAFEGYEDIKEGDIIECYQVVEEARTL
ncbi:MAG: translation initiation factor IF-2 [Micavibrio aeruginosavorus]|uniref:Translation initiation factor IF-2 n=1 Tax=Micavibrio aeruginosavorus TaxID=349221 RepID=A0A2W4ZXW5_9BACT|nr:MAG: translation initiation factor IF-2 [Micavibrio aeruginosavorus]